MGCGRNVGADMLSLALFCTAINQVLVKFCDEDQSGADLWVRVGAAIGFLSCYPERSLKQMKKDGFDLPLTKAVCDAVNIPVIASGGAGTLEHFYDCLIKTGADACLAASIFHYQQYSIRQVKEYLQSKRIPVRL